MIKATNINQVSLILSKGSMYVTFFIWYSNINFAIDEYQLCVDVVGAQSFSIRTLL